MFGYQPEISNGAYNLSQKETPHTFAGNPIDRADALRRDDNEVDRLMRSPEAKILMMSELNPVIESDNDTSVALGWVGYEMAVELLGSEPEQRTFLGLNGDGHPLVAWSAKIVSPDFSEGKITDAGLEICDARESAMMLSVEETGILSQARSNLGWHVTHRFCARCGATTTSRRGGIVRQCVSCGAEHFPRTDPVIITVVTDGDRCLLGQSAGRLRAMRMYSALAGFMDQGESMEEAVRREVKEEAGIDVGEVRYHSSQPWPFPSSLMIGSHSEALTTDIDMDEFEMTDVSWWDREEVLLALAEKSENLRVPGSIAIAHHLIKAWANGKAGVFV